MFRNIIAPGSLKELKTLLRKMNGSPFRFGAGFSDLAQELRKAPREELTVISLCRIRDAAYRSIKPGRKGYYIGAGATASELIKEEDIRSDLPVLRAAATSLASPQIRNVATLGGNMCSASPSGDMSCAMVALQCTCVIGGAGSGTRRLPVERFFTGPRRTALGKKEFLLGVMIPPPAKGASSFHSGFIKIGTRRSMECSVVSIAYHIQIDKAGRVLKAGIAFGACAPVIVFARDAADFLAGRELYSLSEEEKNVFAAKVLSCASPVTDLRASAWYRTTVLENISRSILERDERG